MLLECHNVGSTRLGKVFYTDRKIKFVDTDSIMLEIKYLENQVSAILLESSSVIATDAADGVARYSGRRKTSNHVVVLGVMLVWPLNMRGRNFGRKEASSEKVPRCAGLVMSAAFIYAAHLPHPCLSHSLVTYTSFVTYCFTGAGVM